MSTVQAAYAFENQLGCQWDVIVANTGSIGTTEMPFRATGTSIPFQKLQVERKRSGETVIKGIEDVDTISITFRESPTFSVYGFFQDWMDLYYDRDKRVFKTFSSLAAYNKSLYNVIIVFYTGLTTASTMVPANLCVATSCKPVGLDTLSLDYSGNPIEFTVTLQPETVEIGGVTSLLSSLSSSVSSAISSLV